MSTDLSVKDVIAQREQLRGAIRTCLQQQAEALKPLQDAVDLANQYIISQLPTLTPDDLMELRFDAMEQSAILAGRQEAERAPYTAEEIAVSAKIKEIMLAGNLQQLKTSSGHETHFTTKDTVAVTSMETAIQFMLKAAPAPSQELEIEWPTILDHIKQHGMWGLLNKQLNKVNTRELLEAGTPAETIGVKFTTFKDLVWSRGKKG